MRVINMTCVVCPIGCKLEIERDGENGDGKILSVSGNVCKRGEKYAQDELFNPVRTLTTTVPITAAAARCLPVKTDKPIPKDKLFEIMELVRTLHCDAPILLGGVVAADILPGINLVSCKSVQN